MSANPAARVVALAERDLRRLFREVGATGDVKPALNAVLPELVAQYRALGSSAAAARYDLLREEAGLGDGFAADVLDDDEDDDCSGLIGAALLAATDDASLVSLLAGGVQRRVMDSVRETTAENARRDTAAAGWVRVGHDCCDWCQQYIDGEVRTVEGYDFPAHDNCRCDVEPVFE